MHLISTVVQQVYKLGHFSQKQPAFKNWDTTKLFDQEGVILPHDLPGLCMWRLLQVDLSCA